MTQTPRKARGSAAPQGEAAQDPRILYSTDGLDLPVFRYTQLGPPYIRRSEITRAAYNPRQMDASGKKKLREGLKRFGLVERPIFNLETGILVGGHQRLEQMDRLMDHPKERPDYLLPVNAVRLDATKERELNLLLNNPSVQGSYDMDAALRMFEDGTNPFAAGFDRLELELNFGSDITAQLAQTFGLTDSGGEEEEPHNNDGAGLTDQGVRDREAEKIEALKARKREQLAEDGDRETSDTILHVVFPTRSALRRHLKSLGLDPGANRFIDSERYRDALEAELTGDEL